MKLFDSYGTETISPVIERKISLLFRAAENGKRFFLLPAGIDRETAEWIFASFHAPVCVVPVASSLPEEGIQKIRDQLPAGSLFQKEDFSPSEISAPAKKNLSEFWAVIFTSGSTGDPKGVALTGNQLLASAQAHGKRFPDQPWLLSLAPNHIGGFSILSRSFFLNLPFGISNSDPQEIDSWLSSGKISGISMVPTLLQKFLPRFPKKSYPALKTLLLGGASADPSLMQQARHLPIFLTYGMTESASQCATSRIPGGSLNPLDSFEIKISDDEEILIRGDALAEGYFQRGEFHLLPKVSGFYRTGDLGKIEGEMLQISGRKSERINSGGVKVFPQEIESILKDFRGLKDCAVCSIPDPYWGELICLVFVGNPDIKEPLRAYLEKHLDKRLMPKHILSLPALPRTANGKIQRSELSRIVSGLILQK